jgi:phytanoyl-CoA hydroxylase
MHDINSWMIGRPWIDLDDADVDAHLAKTSEAHDFDLRAALLRWRDEGVVLFENAVDPLLIDALTADIDYLRSHFRDFDLGVEVLGVQKHIRELTQSELESSGLKFNSIHSISYAAARLSLTRKVAVFLRHVFDGPPCALQSLTFYKGSQQPVHIDYPYVRCQSPLAHLAASWIPLEDISPDSGPLAYFPGSHKIDVSGFFDWGGGSILLDPESAREPQELSDYLTQRLREHNIEPRVYCPRKGDALVWHGNLSHEGSRIANDALTRKSYVTHFSSYAAYPRAHLKPGTPGTGYICNDNGGYVFEYSWLNNVKQLPSIASKTTSGRM